MTAMGLAFAIALILLLGGVAGCTTVKDNPPQLSTDTTGHGLTNARCVFFCYVTGTFTGSPGRAQNSGSARSTDSSSFVPNVEPVNTVRLPPRKTGKPAKPLKPLPPKD